MLAASLLARSGHAADEALAAVRRARPGTVETEAQVEIVRASAGS
jgi:protein-tyrosine phosphatase